MGLPSEIITGLIGSSGYSGYQIDQSMVLDGSSDYLSQTPSSTGDRKKWTTSFWIKRHKLGELTYLFTCAAVSGNDGIAALYFNASDELVTYYDTSGANPVGPVTTRKYRDVGSWYHIIWAVDAVNTVHRIWVNGVELTANASYYPPNFDYGMNYASHAMTTGTQAWGPLQYADISIAELHHIDGEYITDPTTFGEFYNGTTAWRPIQPSGLTYGTNGFYLPFTQDTPNLGTDYSGNGNDWTENGSPVQSSDSPTKNIAVLNSLIPNSYLTFSNGNRTVTHSGGTSVCPLSIYATSGKFYCEIDVVGTGTWFGYNGVVPADDAALPDHVISASSQQDGYIWRNYGPSLRHNTGDISVTPTFANGDTLMIALDMDNGWVFFGKNGTWYKTDGTTHTDLTDSANAWATDLLAISDAGWTFAAGASHVSGTSSETVKVASDDWTYPGAAADFLELSAANLPEVTITDPGEYFNAVAYTGDGTAIGSGGQAITGVGFSSDFTWIKNRDQADSHMLFDVLRGATKVLHSNETVVETTESETLTSFDSDGFTLGSDVEVNTNTENYISWNWKAGGAGVANTAGTISSTVSVNDDAGFSIVSYEGTGGAGTVGHGQSEAVEFLLVRSRTATPSGQDWWVWHSALTADQRLKLQDTSATASSSTYWNSTIPTSSLFSIGTDNRVNSSGDDFIAYCFRSIPGYSKVFSYTGNGSADGTFVYLGFKPRWVLMKRSSSTNSWYLFDTERSTFNVVDDYLNPNLSAAETTGGAVDIDLVSNGIKWRSSTAGNMNNSGSLYIGIAFAEYPFGGSNLPLGLAQ